MAGLVFASVLTENEVSYCKYQLRRHWNYTASCHLWLATKDKDKYGLIQFQFRGWRVKVKAHWLSVYVQNHFQQTLINAITCLTKHVFNIRVYCSETCVNAATRVWMVPRLTVPDFLQNWSVYKMIQFYFCSFLQGVVSLAVVVD